MYPLDRYVWDARDWEDCYVFVCAWEDEGGDGERSSASVHFSAC